MYGATALISAGTVRSLDPSHGARSDYNRLRSSRRSLPSRSLLRSIALANAAEVDEPRGARAIRRARMCFTVAAHASATRAPLRRELFRRRRANQICLRGASCKD